MYLNQKSHRIQRIKEYLKEPRLFIICHVSNEKNTNSFIIKKILTEASIDCCIVSNGAAKKVLYNSIYALFDVLVYGTILVLKVRHTAIKINLKKINEKVNGAIFYLMLKVHNNIHSLVNFENQILICYKRNVLTFSMCLNSHVKRLNLWKRSNSK